MSVPIVIAGCGFTGRRVAERLLRQGHRVIALARSVERLNDLAALGVECVVWDASAPDAAELLAAATPVGAAVLYSVPTLRLEGRLDEPAPRLLPVLAGKAARVVYLSTTGVYGAAHRVDEATPVAPETERQRLRAAAERAALEGPWPALVLRPAAIYGPGRGVQVALPEGKYQLVGDGSNFTSRIHVEDLAEIATRALVSGLTGAFPVADERPSSSREIAQFVCDLLGLPLPDSVPPEAADETRRADRRVDGSAIRRLLGVELRYPSYVEGIPASLAEARSR